MVKVFRNIQKKKKIFLNMDRIIIFSKRFSNYSIPVFNIKLLQG